MTTSAATRLSQTKKARDLYLADFGRCTVSQLGDIHVIHSFLA